MTICESCIRNKDCEWNKGNPRHCTLYIDKEETNFDRITASPEALAEFAEHFANCGDDCPVSNKNICEYKCKKCKEALLAWLKQESE